jgi:YHS domain-containing protein
MKKLTKIVALGAVSIWAVLASTATADTVKSAPRTSHDLLGEGVGLVGYDPVSYFPDGGGKPVKGHIMTSAEYDGVTYRFASEEHRALFQKNPAKYVPAYGGWCTWAVAELAKHVDVDPEAYVVKNGKLYVFYRDPKLDTRAKFLEDPDGMLAKAEANWPALSK